MGFPTSHGDTMTPRVNDRDRTGDIHLGKVVLYQLSYVHMRRMGT